MIDLSLIDSEFEKMVKRWRISAQLKISQVSLRRLRYRVKHGQPVRIETKIKLLQRYGFRFEDVKYSDRDVIEVLKFYEASTTAARAMGVEYVFEKFKARRASCPFAKNN